MITFLFNSNPNVPIQLTKKASRGPALPKINENATQLARAALSARVIVAPRGSGGVLTAENAKSEFERNIWLTLSLVA